MLTTVELRAHLAAVSYKPGWEFEIYDGRWEGQHVVIRADLEDSAGPGSVARLDIHSMLPPMRSAEQFYEWLAWRLARIEVHEMREWLKVRGHVLFDPHAPFADRDTG